MAKKASTSKKSTKAATKQAPKKSSARKMADVAASPAPVHGPRRDNIDAIGQVRLSLTAELGRTRETLGTVQEIGDQSLIELDRTVGEPVDVLLNGELFARGEVVTVGENFGVRITEIIEPIGG